jgi:hypothetical protein
VVLELPPAHMQSDLREMLLSACGAELESELYVVGREHNQTQEAPAPSVLLGGGRVIVLPCKLVVDLLHVVVC